MNLVRLPVVLMLAQVVALADGGAVLLRQETGGYLVTAFGSPTPLVDGPADFSVLVQTRDELEPVLDANVTLLLHAEDSGTEIHERLTSEQARNKLLYAAMVTLPKPGKWRMVITVARNGGEVRASGDFDVVQARGVAPSYFSYVAVPPVMVALFVVRERLIRRRSRG